MYLSLKYFFPCLFTLYIWALQPRSLPLLLGFDKVYVMVASLWVQRLILWVSCQQYHRVRFPAIPGIPHQSCHTPFIAQNGSKHPSWFLLRNSGRVLSLVYFWECSNFSCPTWSEIPTSRPLGWHCIRCLYNHFINHSNRNLVSMAKPMADLHSKILDARPPPWGSKFFQFHAVFGEIWQNRMLAPPPRRVGAPSSGKSWIRHWKPSLTVIFVIITNNSFSWWINH